MKKLIIKHPVEFTLNKVANGTNCQHIIYDKGNESFLIIRQKLDAGVVQRLENGEEKLIFDLQTINMTDSPKMKLLKEQKFLLKNPKEEKEVEAQHILYAKSDNIYTDIYLSNSKPFTLSKQMKETEAFLNSKLFIRIQRCYIINRLHIKSHSKVRGKYIYIPDGLKIMIGGKYKESFLKELDTKID